MPLFELLHAPSVGPEYLHHAVHVMRPIAAVKLRTKEHDLSVSDIIGSTTQSHYLGDFDVVFVFTLEAYSERVNNRDEIAGAIAKDIREDLANTGIGLNVRVQLNLCQVGWSYQPNPRKRGTLLDRARPASRPK